MDSLRGWIAEHGLSIWLAVTAGGVLAAIITRDVRLGAVYLAVGAFFVVLSLVVNRALDWWEARRGAGT